MADMNQDPTQVPEQAPTPPPVAPTPTPEPQAPPAPSTPPTEAKPAVPAKNPKLAKKTIFDWAAMSPAQKKKFLFIAAGGVVALLAIVGIVAAALSGPNEATPTATPTATLAPTPTPTPVPLTMKSNLDGVEVATELATRHPLAVMIENTPDTRPQAGLGQASIVYEAIAEGGITRFMALYTHTVPEKVGPVRSARPVYIDYAEEYTPGSAYYAHVGGSPDGLSKIKGDGVYDLDQFSIGTKAFQRFPRAGVATEHTMFTYPNKLFEIAKERGYKTNSDFRVWQFKKDTDITNRPDAQTITVPFSGGAYDVKYVYDKESNTYKRYASGVEHKDANTGKVIAPKNIAVVFVNYSTIDAKGRQKVDVIGEGKAKVFLDGKVIEATYKKASSPGRTIFTDNATGKEVEFNPGQIFFSVVKKEANVTVQ